MLTAKRVTALLSMVTVLVFMAFPAMAAELSVKENRTRSGIVNVAVPYISGSVGGKQVDNLVNKAVLSYVNSQMKQIMSRQEIEAFESTHADPRELGEMLRYNSDLVKYTDKKIVDKNTAGRVTASWYVRNEYEVKAAKDTFYSVILKTKTYTGGAGDVIVWKAMNFDLKDGHLMELKELFDANADYAARLQTLIGYQQKGRARLIRHIKGKNVSMFRNPLPLRLPVRKTSMWTTIIIWASSFIRERPERNGCLLTERLAKLQKLPTGRLPVNPVRLLKSSNPQRDKWKYMIFH